MAQAAAGQPPRVPPVILRKISANGNLIAVSTSSNATSISPTGTQRLGGPSGYIQVRQNLTANTIDLTDEDDPKQRQGVQPPALVAFNQNKSKVALLLQQQQKAGSQLKITRPVTRPAAVQRNTQFGKCLWIFSLEKHCFPRF